MVGLPSTVKDIVLSKYAILPITCVSLALLRMWFSGGWCHSKARLDGKVAIITGANSGIGKETARDFLRRGAKVIMACRDIAKCEAAASELKSCITGDGSVVVKKLDLASLASVRAFSEDILKTERKIHLLINNAGVMRCPKWKTEDGFEMQFGTNHLGHFLLTNLLLDKIKESAPARIVVVSSLAHEQGKINFQDINSDVEYDPATAYRQSKLANVLFTRELHRRLEGSNVSVFSLHPGVIITNLVRHMFEDKPWLKFVLAPISPIFFKTEEQGAQTSIYCAVQEGIENQSGSYFSDCAVKKEAPLARDDGCAKKLWELSEKLTGMTG